MAPEKQNNILITIDVEDWFQVENLRPWFPPSVWDTQETRVQRNTTRLLDLFDTFRPSIKATFFVLGWIAQRFPDVVREIQSRGHEVASHGNLHQLNNHMDEATLRQDLDKSKKLLEDITGTQVRGYRAPNFSINDRVLQLIKKSGYTYDSSYNSFDKHGRYGRISTNGSRKAGAAIEIDPQFIELPISNLFLFGQTLPWGGGGYFRLLPLSLFTLGVRNILATNGAYIFYLHPWEIDPEQPRPDAVKGVNAWRHYLNLEKTFDRLAELITRFKTCKFITCSQYLKTITIEPPKGNSKT